MITTDSTKASIALQQGDLVVLKTDTIYGILASAKIPGAVDKLYAAKQRDPRKSCILLVADIHDIPNLTNEHRTTYLALCKKRPTTIVAPVPRDYLPHLKRQDDTLAFRLVTQPELMNVLATTGPLLAPSANIEGHEPAENIEQAVSYFGDTVAVYVDSGPITNSLPSKIIAINDDDEIEIIRD